MSCANGLKLPMVVYFGFTGDFPAANERHHHFILGEEINMIEIDRFVAKTNEGKEYIIVLYQDYIHTEDFQGSEDVEGQSQYLTPTGGLVNQLDSETFQILDTNEIVRKV